MKTRYIVFIIFIMCALPICASIEKTPHAVRGLLDLRQWDFKKGPLLCDGQWEFYWKQLLNESDFKSSRPPTPSGYINVPGIWNAYGAIDAAGINKTEISGDGYATYRLRILLRDSQPLAFKFGEIGTSYICYLDGKKACAAGTVGITRKDTAPAYAPGIVMYQPEGGSCDVVLQIANFHHADGGAWGAIYIGSEHDIRRLRESRLALDMFLFGSILIMGLYHLGLFIYRQKDRSTLFFAIICFFFSLRILVIEEYYLVSIFPVVSWELILKTQYCTLYMGVVFFLLFFRSLFPREFSRPVFLILLGVGLGFCSLVIVTVARIYTYTIQLFEVYTIVSCLYLILVLARAVRQKRSGAVPLALGFMVLFIIALNDVLYNNLLIHTGYYSHLGLFFFIVSQSFTIVVQYSKTLQQYSEARYKLLQDRMSPHFLFNALNTVHAHLFKEPRQAEKALLMLAHNYRYILEYTEKSVIPFDEEWQFVKNYLDLEELRFKDRLAVTMEKKGDFTGIRIPPLTLQPIVENALQHGLRPKMGTGHLSIIAEKTESRVIVDIVDDGVGLQGTDLYSRSLGNIQDRLAFFCDSSSLVIQQRSGGGVEVRVTFSASGGVQ